MSLSQDIYIQFLDHFSALNNSDLKALKAQNSIAVSHHNHAIALALSDVLEARSL
ncbi:hypothetical protein [Flammeovirga kamogawensis]|uniref:Uncharacterized protein n=1 Tax=Flammeovirga kamogawensis TaxID=373891 RepID=A0ABX8H1R1_9BACT|nr:hypothetical protein [Flammeovirga kamogawensis]MBB6463611.1 hypothetical protein [Flammeovirga kamogawensis]QWG09834.1 hypothetical protein KM029_19330 [Flammeovirga kamogawensis]